MSGETSEILEAERAVKRPPPRWLLTFADMMSLLFTLFVMIVSFADFDKRKFMETMAPVRDAFSQTGGPIYDPRADVMAIPTSVQELEKLEEVQRTERVKVETVELLRRDLKLELAGGLVSVEEVPNGVILRFPSATAFSSGGADLSLAMTKTLDRVAGVLRTVPGTISVTGHTDDLPIGTERFRSNWDLSTARAVSVVHYLLETRVDPHRVAATGYAETRPLVANDSAEHRATNRRVQIELIITSDTAGTGPKKKGR